MTQFKVGDRVVGIGTQDERVIDGKRGTVKQIDSLYATVQFDDNIGGWGDSKLGIPRGHGLYIAFDRLSRLSAGRTIVITHKDNITTARLLDGKKTIKSAEAKCAPGDTFDFTVGANLAFDRLMGREAAKAVEPQDKPKGWSGKVVCTSSEDGVFTVGRVYEFVNGAILRCNSGRAYGDISYFYPFITLEDFNSWCCNAKFIEYKGEA